ncbi:hypothetical protein ASE69_03530 [Sphingomonas sp. Leaf208]|uniref:hypothetical protein n=1 Tax=Sphingomonas sp. Leaf208 TaxID=1735679 RepID=UPI0006F6D5BC|nr:hypothetical protein [Sphingomonas sp. Leaf208]KQM56697.1 hypothetical protein ASE69_03530 [Sphingomonas sp. Leaf208]
MAAKNDKKTLYATRDFKDAGTTRFFERGTEISDAEDGVIANYVAAGLVSHEKPVPPAEAEKAALDAVLG